MFHIMQNFQSKGKLSILNSVFAIPHRFRQTIIASTDLQLQPYSANITFTRNEYYQALPMKLSGDLIEFIKLHHCIVSFRGSNHICYSKFNTAQKTAAKPVCFYIPPPSPVQYKKNNNIIGFNKANQCSGSQE